MKLHDNYKSFKQAIELTSDYFKIDTAFVEKDYYITLLLKELSINVPNLLFKGGTSLSKCFNVIDRFSEDIDLTLTGEHPSDRQMKCIKKEIVDSCSFIGTKIINLADIKSRRDYNCYLIEYPIIFDSSNIKTYLFT